MGRTVGPLKQREFEPKYLKLLIIKQLSKRGSVLDPSPLLTSCQNTSTAQLIPFLSTYGAPAGLLF